MAAAEPPPAATPLAVVMPTRNQAGFLRAAVDSVFAQGLPGLRLYVQDGASSDGTPALLAQLAAAHPGLRWASAPDTGPAEALNRAFARALADCDAPVLGWLNSDDLYTAGAAARALAHLQAQPQLLGVYGEAEHIDAEGRVLGRYPTRGPDLPLAAWADACPICQPTVFLRREALATPGTTGPLDTSLRTAFDYDLWLRLRQAHPGRLGWLPAVQARSRWHAGAITQRLREQVALEGLQVVHRHLGAAPAHWLVTHVGEALAACPFDAEVVDVQRRLLDLAERAAPWLGPGGVDAAQRQMRACAPWRLARPPLVVDVQADGWAGPLLHLRLRQPEAPAAPIATLRLHGRHAWPRPGRLRLKLQALHDGRVLARGAAWWRQRFVLDVPVPPDAQRPGARLALQVHASDAFVPALAVAGAHDRRTLAWVVEDVEALTAD